MNYFIASTDLNFSGGAYLIVEIKKKIIWILDEYGAYGIKFIFI